MTGTEIIMRRSDPTDAAAIADLMATAFGVDGAHRHGAVWWHWKYGSNPAGFQGLVAQDSEGRIVGHFGGVPLEVRIDNQPFTFAQSCDTCTDPAVRRGLRNPGLFARLAQAYTSTFAVPGGSDVMFGLPTKPNYRIGSRYSDYWMLRQQWLLVAENGSSATVDAGVEVHDVTSFDDEVTSLCDRVLPDHRCMARRDARFLRWRFSAAPGSPYRIALARSRTEDMLRGYAVHRPAGFMGYDVGCIVDWLCDPEDHAAARALQAAVRDHYSRLGRAMVVFLCPTSSRWFDVFQEWGFRARPSTYVMTARPFVPQLEPRYLREHWYYTLADFDLF